MNLRQKREMFEQAIQRVEKGWCQGDYCRTAQGETEDGAGFGYTPNSPEVVCWCINGACVMHDRILSTSYYETVARPYLESAVNKLYPGTLHPGMSIPDWNDATGRTQQEILAVLNLAKQMVETPEQEL